MDAILVPLFLLGVAAFVGAIVGADLWFSHRQWVAIWRGHRVKVRMHRAKIFVEIDDKEVFVTGNNVIKNKYEQAWEHPALGPTSIFINKVVKGSDGVDINMKIGEEIIPLIEIERNWYGKLNPDDAEKYWKNLLPTHVDSLVAPRWVAACKILNLVRQSHIADESIRQTANTLQIELRKYFETEQRLGEEDLSILGDDAKREMVRQKIEENITTGLEAVKSLHMAVISIEAHADENHEMLRVQSIIEQLQAEEDVSIALSSLSSASPKNKTQKKAAQEQTKKL